MQTTQQGGRGPHSPSVPGALRSDWLGMEAYPEVPVQVPGHCFTTSSRPVRAGSPFRSPDPVMTGVRGVSQTVRVHFLSVCAELFQRKRKLAAHWPILHLVSSGFTQSLFPLCKAPGVPLWGNNVFNQLPFDAYYGVPIAGGWAGAESQPWKQRTPSWSILSHQIMTGHVS